METPDSSHETAEQQVFNTLWQKYQMAKYDARRIIQGATPGFMLSINDLVTFHDERMEKWIRQYAAEECAAAREAVVAEKVLGVNTK